MVSLRFLHRKKIPLPTRKHVEDRAKAIPFGEYTLCRVLGRRRMYVLPNDYEFSGHLALDGYWEWELTTAIANIVKPGMHVVDVGANVGYFTILLSDLVGPAGKVTAIEPNPTCSRLVNLSSRINGFNVDIHECALGSESGKAFLFFPLPYTVYGRVVSDNRQEGNLSKISVRPLDEVIGDDPVDFMKIDIEGAEYEAWQGMHGIISRNRPLTIALEFSKDCLANPGQFLKEIHEAGFSFSLITEKGPQPTTIDRIMKGCDQPMLLLTR